MKNGVGRQKSRVPSALVERMSKLVADVVRKQREIERALSEKLAASASLSPAEQARAVEKTPGIRHGHASVLLCREAHKYLHSDAERSERLVGLADVIAERLPDADAPADSVSKIHALAEIEKTRGNLYFVKGDYKSALKHYDLAEKRYLEMDDVLGVADVLVNRGNVHKNCKEFKEALAVYNRAEKIYRDFQFEDRLARVALNQGNIYQELNEWQTALRYHEKALDYFMRDNDEFRMAHCHLNKGECLSHLNRSEAAVEHMTKAEAIYKKHKASAYRAKAVARLGQHHYRAGQSEKAMRHFEKARALFRKAGNAVDQALVSLEIAKIHLEGEEHAKALAICRAALPPLKEQRLIELHRAMEYIGEALKQRRRQEETMGILSDVARFVRDAQADPSIKFHPA